MFIKLYKTTFPYYYIQQQYYTGTGSPSWAQPLPNNTINQNVNHTPEEYGMVNVNHITHFYLDHLVGYYRIFIFGENTNEYYTKENPKDVVMKTNLKKKLEE